MEVKLMSLEQNVGVMSMEQRKERDSIGRIEVNSLKNSEEFRNVIGNLQNEYQYKLEARMTDLVNRLLTEQEERSRALDDVRYQLEVKDKMTNEKTRHQAEEMRDRYNQMDSVIRSEFQRKDQMIQSLQNSLES